MLGRMESCSQRKVSSHLQFFVELQLFHWDLHKVPCHWIWFGPGGLSFQYHNILALNIECSVNVLNCYWTVLDLVAPNFPFKILLGWIIELGVQRACDLHILDLPLHESCLILRDSINKSKLTVSWIKIV